MIWSIRQRRWDMAHWLDALLRPRVSSTLVPRPSPTDRQVCRPRSWAGLGTTRARRRFWCTGTLTCCAARGARGRLGERAVRAHGASGREAHRAREQKRHGPGAGQGVRFFSSNYSDDTAYLVDAQGNILVPPGVDDIGTLLLFF
jgi:hypothetical protein